MPQYVPLPDGSYVTVQEGETPAAAWLRAQKQYPEAFEALKPKAQPESGFLPALRAGATELGGGISALMGKVGIRDMEKAQAEYDAAKKRASEIFKPTEAGWTEAPLTKFGELLGGSLPYMAAPLAAGAAAAALPVTGTAATVLGLGAAGLTSAGQFTATNLARQMEGEEGTMPKKRLAETELGSAALAAIPQAALDTLSMRMIPGIGRIFGQAGIKVTAETAKEIAEQGLKKTLADYGTKTFKTAGIEGVTEAAQQVFERLQAGLSITDPKAREEYFDSFLGGAVLGGTLAPAGRFIERGREQREARGLLDAQAQKERADAAKAEEEKKAQPEYLEGLYTSYQDLLTQKNALDAQIKKGTKEAPLTQEDKDANAVINRQLNDLKKPLEEARKAFIDAGGPQAMQKLREQQRVAGMAPDEYEEYAAAQRAAARAQAPAPAPAPEVEETLAPDFADPLAVYGKGPSQEVMDYVAAQMRAAQRMDQGGFDVNDYAQFLLQDPAMARQVVAERPPIPGVSQEESAEIIDELKLQLDALVSEMAAGRELEAATRAQSDTEQQAAREQAAKSAALQQQLAFEGEAERTAMQELAASRAADMRVRGLQATRTAPQLGLFPEERETVTQTEKQGAPGKTLIARQIESVTKQLGDVQRQLDEAQAAPTNIGGPWTDLQGAERTEYGLRFVEDLNKRKQQLENVLGGLRKQQEAATVPAGARVERAPATLLAPAQPDTRPQGALAERLNVLAERVLAAPNADEETKNLVRQVQDNLPRLLQQETRPERVLGKRGELAVQQAEAASVGAWLYRTLQGTAPADLTQDIRNRLAELEAGKRSETEQVTQYAGRALTPQEQQAVVGTALEVRRAVQTEIEMPEPTAKAFQSFGAFNDYLASEGLQAYRLQKGLVFPTLANLQKKLAPIQTRVQALQKQLDEVNTRRAALQKADVAERGAASELLREAQQKLKTVIQSLDDTARTTYVGQQLKKVDLVDLLDEAHGRLNAGLAHSANLREQFAQALKSVASAEDATTPIMVDANGNATTKEKKAVRTVARGQLPGYQALRKAQLDLQAKGIALVQADQKLEQVIKAGIGQSWDAGSPTLNAYLRAKKAKDEAQRAAQQAHYVLVQAYKRIPSTEALNNNLAKFLTEKNTLDSEMAKAAKSLSDIRLGVRNASNRLNDAYTRAENNPDLRFGESLLRLRNDLLAAESISNEAMGRSVVRQAQSERLLQESRDIAQPMRAMKQQVSTALREAQQRAAERQVEPVETRADREAQDAEQRREEQARLERADTGPRTLVEFKRMGAADEKLRKFAERLQAATTAGERATIRKELDEYLKERIVKKEADLDEMKRKAAKNIQDMNAQRKVVAELTERLKGDLTPKRRESAEKQLAEAQRKVAEHQRRYLLNTKEMKVTRTDIQTQRQDRNRLLAEASGRRVEGERLGVAEGTQPRATGPVTTPEVTPPKALRTGSEESRAGETATDARQRLTEARGVQQRDVALSKKEQAEANRIAAELAKQTPEQKAAAAKEEATVQEEQAKLQATPAKVKPLKEAAEKRKTKPTRSEVVEDIEEDLYEEPEIEVLGGPEEDVFLTAKRPPMSADAMQAARSARELTGMPRIDAGAPDDAFYKASGFQPEASAPFHKMTLADAARFGASKARGQRKELFTRLADLFDEAATPEKQGLVFATNGRRNPEGAVGAFYSKRNVVFTPSTSVNNYLEILLHELTHAASSYALSVDKRLAGRVESLRSKAVAWAETKEGKAYVRKHSFSLVSKDPQGKRGIYGLKNIDEFLSELYADREFQKFLTQIPSDAPKKNLLTRFVEFMSSFFSASDQAQQSLFAEAVALSEEVLETTRREIYGTDVELTNVRRSRLSFDAEAASDVAFSAKLPIAARVADSLIAKEKGWLTKLKENFLGLGARTQFVDKLAPSEEALKRGGVDPTKALQAMYYLRMYDMRMHFTSQSITEGVPELVEKTRRDGKTERIIETKPGANIQQVVDILKAKDVVKAAGSADGANKLFTLYLAAIRGDRVGYDTLNFGRVWAEAEVKRIESQLKSTTLSQEQRSVLQKRRKDLADKIPTMPTEADIKAARAEIEADPTLKKAFDEARDIYNQYNRNLLEFSVQTGAISRAEANKYLSNNDYIPYYRMRDGVAEMVIGNETPIRIGNLKDSPHLKELVGGDEAIFDFLTSSVQNTSMLLDMATKNLATKNLMFELRDVGLATISKVPKNGKVPEGAVTFKRDGEDHFAIVDTDTIGINSDLLVKGLAGIPTMFPAFIRVLGIPSRILRRVVVASPVYMGRQLFRDSLGAALTSGADIVPVLSALKQIGKPSVLQSRGITGGQVFTGMPEDVTRMLKNMQAGKISVTNGLAWLEAKSAQVDGLTREAQYDSYLKQGMSEMEATLMALESMNFSKRGLSPGMHMASTLIPFFNSQIQGLDVLYKAFTGQMPLNERLAVREKLWTRGLMLAGLSMAYAVAMQDDETYKNAKPEEKYGNWFVKVPGFDQMVRLPVPFELGYIFKSLPEAMVNIVVNDKGGEEAGKALTHIVRQMVPGLSSYFMPQAVKPALEVALGKSMYTGRDIESAREKMVEPGYRYRDNTTSLAREVGELTGFSPIKMEYLINGYFGTLGMALLGALSAPFGKEGPEAATKRASDMPVVGTLFQPNDASGIIDATYERMNEIKQIKQTYEDLIEKGRQADAAQYLKQNMDDMSLAAVAGSFTQAMKQIAAYERAVKASSMSPDAKREQLDKARQIKIQIASSVRAMADKKAPQAALP